MLDTEANQPSISLGITMVSVRAIVTLKRYQLCQVPVKFLTVSVSSPLSCLPA